MQSVGSKNLRFFPRNPSSCRLVVYLKNLFIEPVLTGDERVGELVNHKNVPLFCVGGFLSVDEILIDPKRLRDRYKENQKSNTESR